MQWNTNELKSQALLASIGLTVGFTVHSVALNNTKTKV